MTKASIVFVALIGVGLLGPQTADAFCGFYVAGGDAALFNNATQVVLMREGQRTVLSMQNNYQGLPADFAMVVPVPVVLQQTHVNVLDNALFEKIDRLSAPRLVEYWEQDPCDPYVNDFANAQPVGVDSSSGSTPTVTVEAEFSVGEYDIAILSASDSTGLEQWLVDNAYNIPEGSGTHLERYVESGLYFFVARVDAERVTFRDGRAVLSPLRFYYDSPEFSLPIRLGLINASGDQDLIVYTLGQNQRYEVANYDNAFIPTNIAVTDAVRDRFGGFYQALFARTLEVYPGSVVTEYSWNASSCDPCPGPTLDATDFATLGADVIGVDPEKRGWTLTRLHARYDSSTLGEDLVFREAAPIAGGRETYTDDVLERGIRPNRINNFQGRYIIRHDWDGDVACEEPLRGHWGGPPGDSQPSITGAPSANTSGEPTATENETLEDLVAEDIPEIEVARGDATLKPEFPGIPFPGKDNSGCATLVSEGTVVPVGLWMVLIGAFVVIVRRRQ